MHRPYSSKVRERALSLVLESQKSVRQVAHEMPCRYGLNEFEYLCDVLDRLADLGSQAELHDLLPDKWKPKT